MKERLKATFQKGAFIPQQSCNLPEGSEVELIVQGPTLLLPESSDPEERKRILREVVESIKQNPFPVEAPRFTREELHDRH
ncbi:MAG: DUF104 domain-containing protein [Acidobacteria bacterium]|nr:DUF104 domain-containing protein [Acidobacteriota bacterium]